MGHGLKPIQSSLLSPAPTSSNSFAGLSRQSPLSSRGGAGDETSVGGRGVVQFYRMYNCKELPRPKRVKNKTPAPIQITAEKIFQEARQRQESEIRPPTKQKIADGSELADYQARKRKEFEDVVRRARCCVGSSKAWIGYAQWEESQKDFARARSVWERALEANHMRDHTLWIKYAQVEMKNKFVNHARNVWDRAVTLLPRVDQLWYKYIHMEEMLGNVAGARQIFERWMSWTPGQHGWLSYIKFEVLYGEVERARSVFERFVLCRPNVEAWIRFAKFETKHGEVGRARNCYERAAADLKLGADNDDDEVEAEQLYVAFAEFEEMNREVERERRIYRCALDHIPKRRAQDLYKRFVAFEKRHGDREGIEDAIVGRRRLEYEHQVQSHPLNYDAWFDYIRLEESVGMRDRIRRVYKRAVANVPPAKEKRFWQRYVYIWINYALYEELEARDLDRTRDVYRECLKLIPHKKFTFAKVWILAAQFEIRRMNLKGTRQILGTAIGMAPRDKIFNRYIEIELLMGNMDRCRKLYGKYLEWAPANCHAWTKFAEMEKMLGEKERSRGVFELAIAQPALDMPELLWKAYIDLEIAGGELERTRQLYERLLDRTKHVKVWISYANFEATASRIERGILDCDYVERQNKERHRRSRQIFERALSYLKTAAPELKEERAMVLDEWWKMENGFGGGIGDDSVVKKQLPRKVKRRRPMATEDGTPAGYEEYFDYVFPDDEVSAAPLKILEAAYKWKKQKQDHHQ